LTNMIGLGNLATWPDWTGGENTMHRIAAFLDTDKGAFCVGSAFTTATMLAASLVMWPEFWLSAF
jgi:hypothetical protein